MNQRRVDAGLGRYRPNRGRLKPPLSEQHASRREDLLGRAGRAWPASRLWHRSSALDICCDHLTFNHVINSSVVGKKLRVVRGGHEVLNDVDFVIRAGAVTGLLGPSGSGKTTLLRSILGVQRIAGGTVTVLGRPAGSPVLRTQVGYASQAASAYDDLTVTENLRYFAAAVRAPAGDAERVLAAVDLNSHANRLVRQLSGGQRSRVSLAVAMLGTPRLLVLDEPTVGLDPVLREELWALFHRLAAAGMTILVSSHVMDEAERCHELQLLREGRLLAHDTPLALKHRTSTDSMDAAFLRLVTGDAA
jgi:ABC-2 type transport system ATP-binding protein